MRRWALALAAGLSGCAAERPQGPIDPDHVPIVWGGGASIRSTFRVSPARWEELSGPFIEARDAAAERAAVRFAIGLMERIAGEQTVTWMDKSCNGNGGPTEQGQLDCIDESTNTTTYLHLFDQRGLLRFHRVLGPVWRAPHLVDTHRTAVLEEIATGRRYSVDSWFGDNGTPPIIQPLDDWKRKRPPPPQ
jgi:hypothetical protein